MVYFDSDYDGLELLLNSSPPKDGYDDEEESVNIDGGVKLPSPANDLGSPKKKSKKKKKDEDSPTQTFSTNIVGGPVIVQHATYLEGLDAQRRK